jgi:hypothetical protein
MLKHFDTEIDILKAKLSKCFSENPLRFWDKIKIKAKLAMKDTHKIIRVQPMRYNPKDQEEFRK